MDLPPCDRLAPLHHDKGLTVTTITDGNLRRRTSELRLKLQPEIASEIEAQAIARGLAPATLGASILGEWLEQQRRQLHALRIGVVESSRYIVKEMINPDFLAQLASHPELQRLILADGMPSSGQAGQAGSSAGPEAAASTDAPCAAGEDRVRTAT